jgi:hypothetical protein
MYSLIGGAFHNIASGAPEVLSASLSEILHHTNKYFKMHPHSTANVFFLKRIEMISVLIFK